ncbi:hypothetical protein SAMN00777080_2494 [Aquiflexum balticum DSM 16537]|uniref:Uncharacterized protein n=1 Tax=Aquiflexum balticum DSM 16537 TaxID=758820 RepID=A0A1W2H4Q0_9BACT|nr:hypothetical protein [Aquiflexum balticum]SMD43881.1 hypothetical protein SAMN00777080_2494 [Aquiflexum balticum DSM 16537]
MEYWQEFFWKKTVSILFADDYDTESFKVLGFYAYDDFYEFGLKIDMLENRIRTILDKYRSKNKQVIVLTPSSFLTEPIKELYINHYLDRLKMLNNSFSIRI